MTAEDTPINIADVMAASRSSALKSMWDIGTAAAISPVDQLAYQGETMTINENAAGPVARLAGSRWQDGRPVTTPPSPSRRH